MPDDLIDTLCRIATEKGISFNQLVIQCCEFALDNLNIANSAKETDE